MDHQIIPLDLNFQGQKGVIASYLLPHQHGAILIESGPGSTQDSLQAGLAAHGYSVHDVTDVLLTHIHLDHAGAAGWLAQQGAHIYVHEVGAPHLIDPSKLLSSAQRIYGEKMQTLWGDFLAVPADKLTPLHDNEVIQVGKICLRALDTPGHAYHHLAYQFEDTVFSGDVGGIRLQELDTISIPMPPPELHLEKWRQSVRRLADLPVRQIAPTHFGLYPEPARHLAKLTRRLDAAQAWIENFMPTNPDLKTLEEKYIAWIDHQNQADGLDAPQSLAIEIVNPAYMSAAGIQRYWLKVRAAHA